MREAPHDSEAEAAILGAVILENSLIWNVIQKVRPSDFYHPFYRIVAEAVFDICQNGDGKVDAVSLRSALQSRGEAKMVGGAMTISGLIDGVPDVANLDAYVDIVLEKASARRVIEIGQRMIAAANRPHEALSSAMAEMVETISYGRKNPLVTFQELAVEQRRVWDAGGEREIINTGIPTLDEKMVIMKGHDVVVAGNPGTGKTAFATQVAMKTSSSRPVLFASLEMSPMNIFHRALQSQTGMSVPVIINPQFTTDANREKLKDANDFFTDGAYSDLYVMRPGLITPQDVLSAARSIQMRRGDLALVIVDYIQLMHCPEKGFNSQERVSWLSRNLKAVALQLDVPVFVLSQLNRGQVRDGREPELYDLRDSGAIEQDADIVIFTHRPEPETNDAAFLVKKQRYGETCRVRAKFDGARTRFYQETKGYQLAIPEERTYHHG